MWLCFPQDPLFTRQELFGLPYVCLIISLKYALAWFCLFPHSSLTFLVNPHGVGLTKSHSYGSPATCGGWCLFQDTVAARLSLGTAWDQMPTEALLPPPWHLVLWGNVWWWWLVQSPCSNFTIRLQLTSSLSFSTTYPMFSQFSEITKLCLIAHFWVTY